MVISSSAPKIQSMTLLKLSRNPKMDWQEWVPCLLILSNRIAVGFLKEATSENNTVVSDSPGLEVLLRISELSLLNWMNITYWYPSHLGTRAPLRICRRNAGASPPFCWLLGSIGLSYLVNTRFYSLQLSLWLFPLQHHLPLRLQWYIPYHNMPSMEEHALRMQRDVNRSQSYWRREIQWKS